MQATDDLSRAVRLGPLSVAKVMRALLEGPCSLPELQDASGLSTNTLYGYLKALRKEGVVHISAWEKDNTGRESLRVFKLGPGRDAPRKRKSKAQIAKECRKRKQEALMLRLICVPTEVAENRHEAIPATQMKPAMVAMAL